MQARTHYTRISELIKPFAEQFVNVETYSPRKTIPRKYWLHNHTYRMGAHSHDDL